MNQLIPLYIILPLAAGLTIPVISRFWKGYARVITPLIFLALTAFTLYFLLNGEITRLTYYVGGWEPVNNINIGIVLMIDNLSLFILLIINLIGFAASLYSIDYIKKFTAESNFYTLFCMMGTGMNGVAITGDIFNLFVFLEIAVIAAYALVAFGVEREELEASFKYQVLGGMASLLIIFGIGLLYWHTGSLNIADIRTLISTSVDARVIVFIQAIFITGFGLKAAMIPFHSWLPDAHSSAPSPISAMLSGVLIKAIGVYVLVRLFFNMFAISHEIAVAITTIGTLSMLIGVLLAIGQWDIKRLLAYHSISQMGYVFLGIGIGMLVIANGGSRIVAALSIMGGLYHLINHAIFKGLLFLTAGSVEHRIGTRNLKEMGGLSRQMPLTATTNFSASMAISGIPPFNGFFSKLIIIIAAVQAQYYLLAFLAVFVSVVTLASFMKVQKYAFFNNVKKTISGTIREAPFFMSFSMVLLAVLCIVLSALILPGLREIFLNPTVDVLLDGNNFPQAVLP
jgi:multicomponent Na+:H+ antiporter subunit D